MTTCDEQGASAPASPATTPAPETKKRRVVRRRPRTVTTDEVLREIRRLVAERGDTLTKLQFAKDTGLTDHHIKKVFPRGWAEAREAAGLSGTAARPLRISDDEVMRNYHRIVGELGRLPSQAEYTRRSPHSHAVLRRFGGVRAAARRYRLWLEANPELAAQPMLPATTTGIIEQLPAPPDQPTGPSMSPCAMSFAPTNELGVVCLFGILADRLGFVIEAVQAAFPDCRAHRATDEARTRWQRVRIEFEYRSRAFATHGHNPDHCDLLVCWEHNWDECPEHLEVIELRRVVGATV